MRWRGGTTFDDIEDHATVVLHVTNDNLAIGMGR